ncbi:bifunctional diguanylate cyclase/phosphodiesterase [Fictibacillus barbaricus]|uniref:Diguanylate cyclase (GGDEF)-like protein/PAS domain S-box-containing protein n=1 Tax=Fictibacillus barbaricus TaxID=182136 RepID=A0ABU1TXM0_9BACL|nr:EAL domain-containing protein [Fictibacillus barbaricus]MDR7071955.1 diguanylate cyclase (GGDEF)-like protein/PAS domain S-box-containing protein [Fictibacillus barbaricus]
MKTFNFLYKNEIQFKKWIKENDFKQQKYVLVQVFTGRLDKTWINRLREKLTVHLPNAKIIGVTTDGEVLKGRVTTKETVISISIFEKSLPRTSYIPLLEDNNSEELGKHLAQNFINEKTKLLLIFGNGMYMESSSFLQGIHSVAPKVIVSGGNAGDNGLFKNICLFTETGVFDKGVVAAAIDSEELYVNTMSYTEWKPAGKVFSVTDVSERGELEVDGLSIYELYAQYLGKEIAESLPESAAEYPLIVKKDKSYFPLSIKVSEDGNGFSYHQTVKRGNQLQIGYRDASLLINTIDIVTKDLQNKPAESIFMYSCMARRRFLKSTLEEEFFAIDQFVPTTGFFTYGEYFHDGKQVHLLSHALTLLILSETADATFEKRISSKKPEKSKDIDELLALSHLIQTSTEEMKQLNDNLLESEQRYKSLFEHNPDLIYSMDLNGYITSVNPALVQTLGYSQEEMMKSHALKFVCPENHKQVIEHFKLAIHEKPQTFVMTILKKDGKNVVCSITNIPIVVNQKVVGIYGIGKNITWQKKAEEKMERLAFHDSLTGLPNRSLFEKRLHELLEESDRNNQKLAVMFIDLDRFKIINESLGHHIGDVVLKHVSKQLRKATKNHDLLCRFTGDVFALILPSLNKPGEIIETTERITEALKMPIYLDGEEYTVSASIGISIYPDDTLNTDVLLKNADIAVHKAKEKGFGKREFFTGEMNAFSLERLRLEGFLRKAIQKGELLPFFQPQICMKTEKIIGFEALIRWQHPELGLISPMQFIPLAEEIGLIDEIGRFVLFESCKQLKQWHDEDKDHLSISVNVSSRQFQRLSFVYEVKEVLELTGIPAHCLNLELTESTMIHNVEYSISIMEELRELGVKLSIDDFGTGYSSLSYLKDLPVDSLKIDQSFIRHLSEDYFNTSDAAIIKAIIMMCEGLSLTTVAEGVETFEQLKLLQEYGCHHAQGYIISKPMPSIEADVFLKFYSLTKNSQT